jgi:hypothetical protein
MAKKTKNISIEESILLQGIELADERKQYFSQFVEGLIEKELKMDGWIPNEK